MTDAAKTIATNDKPAGTGGQFVPETRIISQAMYALAEEIQSDDGVANAACRQAAERLDAQTVEIERLRAALRTTQKPVAWAIFAESGAIRMWSKHQPHVKKVADAGGLKFLPLYTTPPEAAPRQPLTRETIRAIFMAHGFTIKEGQTDLKDYVYQAAEALLAAAHGIGAEKSFQELPQSPITEEMHQAACKVLVRAHGLDGTPQRMLDAMRAVAPKPGRQAQEPVGVVESAVYGCAGFHVKLRPGQDTPRIGTNLYAVPPVVQWTAADDTEGGDA